MSTEYKTGQVGGFAGRAARVLFTLLVLAGVMVLLKGMSTIKDVMGRNAGDAGKNTAMSAARNHVLNRKVASFFPRFPGCTVSQSRAMELNGVETISEEWETTASSAEILDFLKAQLGARGWVDTTEDSFGLSPELRGAGDGGNSLQDPKYLKIYAETIESCLVMQNGSWCMQATLQHGRTASGRIALVLFAAKTPSFSLFAEQLALSIAQPDEPGQKDGVMEVSERSGSNLFHTRVINSRNSPDSAMLEIAGMLADERWSSVFVSAKQDGAVESQYTLLRRGEQFAYLTVSPSENGRGSHAVFTEVSEERPKETTDIRP